MDTDFQTMIQKYRDELLQFGAKRDVPQSDPKPDSKPVTEPASPTELPLADPIPGEIVTPRAPLITEPAPTENPDLLTRDGATGTVTVHTYTADGALPVQGALITISSCDQKLIRMLVTDADGNTDQAILPTRPKSESESPEDETPYSVYNIQVTASGYRTIISENVPIFPGVSTVQNFELIPLPDFEENEAPQINENTQPNL